MNKGDVVALLEAIALMGTWYWVLRRPITFDGRRRKFAIFGLGFASLAVISDLILTVVMHFHQNPDDIFAAKAFLAGFLVSIPSALAGLICGIVGKGTPRIAAIIWSTLMLALATATLCQTLMQAE